MTRVTVQQGSGAFHEVDVEASTDTHVITVCRGSIPVGMGRIVIGEVGCRKCTAVRERELRAVVAEAADLATWEEVLGP